MPTIRFNSAKQVQNPPVALGESDVLSFSLINTDSDLTEGGTSEIAISLEKPIAIHEGDFQFSYDSVSTPFIPAKDCTAYNIGLALNSLSTIASAGGVEVTGSMPFPLIKFNAVGSRETFVITHSILGALPYRAVTLTAGTGSVKSTVEFDLSLQTLVKSATATDLTAPTLTVANISTGSASAYQEDRITLSGKPEAGGFSIRTATDTITRLVPYSASAYEVKSALDAVASGLFTVRRAETGESIYWNIRRLAKGANDAITVESQLESATGISMSLSLANVRELLSIVGAPAKVPVILSLRYDSVLQFSIPVELTAPDPSGSVSFLTAPDAGSSQWGAITGVLADQTDLQAALDDKMDLDSGQSTDGQVWTSDGLGSAAWETPTAFDPTAPGPIGGTTPDAGYFTTLESADSVAVSDMTDVWNDSGTTFTGIGIDVTDTASAAASMLLDLKVGGTSRFNVRKDGQLTTAGDIFVGNGITIKNAVAQNFIFFDWAANILFYQDIQPAFSGVQALGKTARRWGRLWLDTTITAPATTGAQTIDKATGSVNFAAAATSLVVTNSLVTTDSIIICTVRTNDSTMMSVQAVGGSGSFTLYPNAAPTAETRVDFFIIN
jgi:hypothetical protein